MLERKDWAKQKFSAEVVRVQEGSIVYPGDSFICNLHSSLRQAKKVFLALRASLLEQGASPFVAKVNKNGSVAVPNNSQKVWNLKKSAHFIDCRQALLHEEAVINKLYIVNKEELENFKPWQVASTVSDFTNDIALDPDGILTTEEKASFRALCAEFKEVVQYDP